MKKTIHMMVITSVVATALTVAAPMTAVMTALADETEQTDPPGTSIVPPAASAVTMNVLLASQTTDYHHASLSQTKNIELVAKRLNGVVIPPHGKFSYYNTVGPYTADNGYHWGRAFVRDKIVPSMGGGVCQGASTLYSALLRTGLTVTERHPHSMTVPYLPAGEDATVASTYYNFRFTNNRDTPIRLAASANTAERKLKVAVYGTSKGPHITVHHERLSTTPFQVKTTHSKTLAAGERKVISPGHVGEKVHTWLEVTGPDGKVTKKDLGTDRYLPSPRVIEIGTKQSAQT